MAACALARRVEEILPILELPLERKLRFQFTNEYHSFQRSANVMIRLQSAKQQDSGYLAIIVNICNYCPFVNSSQYPCFVMMKPSLIPKALASWLGLFVFMLIFSTFHFAKIQ